MNGGGGGVVAWHALASREEERHTHHRMAPKVAVGRFGRDVIAVAERERGMRHNTGNECD